MTKKTRILIVEEMNILRAALRAILSAQPHFEVVGDAADGREAVRAACIVRPHLILTGLSMSGISGIDTATEIAKRYPNTRVVFLLSLQEQDQLPTAMSTRAAGYLSKNASANELIAAIESVVAGKPYICRKLQERLIHGIANRGCTVPAEPAWTVLTQRERQILKLIAEARTNKEIALYLCISVKTVEKHRASLMGKLKLRNAAALTSYAMDAGIARPVTRSPFAAMSTG